MLDKMENILDKIFGNNTHLKVILLFYEEKDGYFDNITGLANALDKSHVTVRKVVSDLVDARILKEVEIGKSRVIRMNEDGPHTKALFKFLDSIRSINETRNIESLIEKRSERVASKRA